MCGIAVGYAYHPAAASIDPGDLRRVRDDMAPRGPDGRGEWYARDWRAGLGHRRLAVLDPTERAAQPMVSEDGRHVITYNGEIYNHAELRQQLEDRGCKFRSQGDTEVLLHLFREKGPDMVNDLRGMFAFAIWDEQQRRLFLARDPMGVKPLYYWDDGWSFWAASQVRALQQLTQVSRRIDSAGLVGFYLSGSVPEPFTWYRDVHALPAGSTLVVDDLGAGRPRSYYTVAETFHRARQEQPAGELADEVQQAVADSVRHHLVSDVPVGAFLSAGIDSGVLVSFAHGDGAQALRTVTLGFEEYSSQTEEEVPGAERIARHYHTDQHTCFLSRSEFQKELNPFLAAMDQPTIDGVNTYFVSKAAREAGLKVAISGIGGDELFGGYPSFLDMPAIVRWARVPGRLPGLGRLARNLMRPVLPRRASPKLSSLLEYGGSWTGAYLLRRGLFLPWELPAILDPDLVRAGLQRLTASDYIHRDLAPDPGSAFGRVATLEASLYLRNQILRDADWAGMAHSLEIRVPYVDRMLWQRLAGLLPTLPPPQGKQVLAHAPVEPLPEEVAKRRKTGFAVPLNQWLEDSESLDEWRQVPSLARPGCPWARRWAYVVARRWTAHERSVAT